MKTFTEFNTLQIKQFVKRKNGYNYLPWAKAWQIAKEADSAAEFEVLTSKDNSNLFYDVNLPQFGAKVSVKTTVFGKSHVEMLPVMDFRNKSIPLNKITSCDENDAIKRCLVKSLALHGIGLTLYQGELFGSQIFENDDKKSTVINLEDSKKDSESWLENKDIPLKKLPKYEMILSKYRCVLAGPEELEEFGNMPLSRWVFRQKEFQQRLIDLEKQHVKI